MPFYSTSDATVIVTIPGVIRFQRMSYGHALELIAALIVDGRPVSWETDNPWADYQIASVLCDAFGVPARCPSEFLAEMDGESTDSYPHYLQYGPLD